jgi:hypothetical protein
MKSRQSKQLNHKGRIDRPYRLVTADRDSPQFGWDCGVFLHPGIKNCSVQGCWHATSLPLASGTKLGARCRIRVGSWTTSRLLFSTAWLLKAWSYCYCCNSLRVLLMAWNRISVLYFKVYLHYKRRVTRLYVFNASTVDLKQTV